MVSYVLEGLQGFYRRLIPMFREVLIESRKEDLHISEQRYTSRGSKMNVGREYDISSS